ncbi:MAG: methyltransferase domain-containing protein [Thermoanaerobaculia bacterium]
MDETLQAAMAARFAGDPLPARTVRDTVASLARAALTNQQKYTAQLREAAPALAQYLKSFSLVGAPANLTRSYVDDAFGRFLHTLELLPIPLVGQVLEVGANPYLFHLLLKKIFPATDIRGMNFFEHDIYSRKIGTSEQTIASEVTGESYCFNFPTFNLEVAHPYPYAAQTFDVILFCETLEHLVLNPLRVFREFRRILRPGGLLVITLPNALRLANVAAMLGGRNFFDLYWVDNGVHGRHNREFTVEEVVALLRSDGYEVVRSETRDRFDYDRIPMEAIDYSGPPSVLPFKRKELLDWIRMAGGTPDNRGDNIYVVARRGDERESSGAGLEPPADGAPPPDSLRLVTFLDEVSDWADRIRVVGWGYVSDNGNATDQIELVFRGERGGSTSRRCGRMSRSDVASAHGLEHDDVGFVIEVAKSTIPAGRYQLSVRFRSVDGTVAERQIGVETTVSNDSARSLSSGSLRDPTHGRLRWAEKPQAPIASSRATMRRAA